MDAAEFKKQKRRTEEYQEVAKEIEETGDYKDFIMRSEHSAIRITTDALKDEQIVLVLETADTVRRAISIALGDRITELNKELEQI